MANILITGSSTGIGLSTALRFARAGHKVYASLRNPEGAPELQDAIAQGLPITAIKIDVNSDDSVTSGVAEVLHQAGHIDVLVNNAGVGGGGPIEISSIEVAREVFETNYFGAIRMIRAVLPGMRVRRSGTIVNVTSVAGRFPAAAHGHYSASKFALEAASESLAQEVLPFGIRVAIIEPGVILTPIFSKHSVDFSSLAPYETPVRRLMSFFAKQLQNPQMPELVAEAIEHAVLTDSPKLRYLVGEDAKTLIAGRTQVSDEDWIADSAIAEDEAYYDRMKQRFGTDMYR
jgi:NAD(P)-dependent dehydrogenase (short-subunit alcohol dehydrogenase family)